MTDRSRVERIKKLIKELYNDSLGVMVFGGWNTDLAEGANRRRITVVSGDDIIAASRRTREGIIIPANAAYHNGWWKIYSAGASVGGAMCAIAFKRKLNANDMVYLGLYGWKHGHGPDDLDYVVDSRDAFKSVPRPPTWGDGTISVIENDVSYLLSLSTIAARKFGVAGRDQVRSREAAVLARFPAAILPTPGHKTRWSYTAIVDGVGVSVSGHMINMLKVDAAGISPIATYIKLLEGNARMSRMDIKSRFVTQVRDRLTQGNSYIPTVLWHRWLEYDLAIDVFERDWYRTEGSISARSMILAIARSNPALYNDPTLSDYICNPHCLDIDLSFKNKLLVAPSGSGKSSITDVSNFVDMDTEFDFNMASVLSKTGVLDVSDFSDIPIPVILDVYRTDPSMLVFHGERLDDADIAEIGTLLPDNPSDGNWFLSRELIRRTDSVNVAILRSRLRQHDSQVLMYADNLGLIPDIVVIIDEEEHKRRLVRRNENQRREGWPEHALNPGMEIWPDIKQQRARLARQFKDKLFDNFDDVVSVYGDVAGGQRLPG
jgi:hypothetical protein